MKFTMYVKENNMIDEISISAENEEEALYIFIDEKLQLIKGIKYVHDLRKNMYDQFDVFAEKLKEKNRCILSKEVMVEKC